MDAPPVQYVTTSDGYSIAYSVSGEGRPLVMVPMLAADLIASWRLPSHRNLYEQLANRYRLVRIDLRGCGLSTRGEGIDFTTADFVHDIESVVNDLGLSSFVLCGCNVGERASIQFAATYPERAEANVWLGAAFARGGGRMASANEEQVRQAPELFWEARAPFFAPLEPLADYTQIAQDFISIDKIYRDQRSAAQTLSNVEGLLPQIPSPTLLVVRRPVIEAHKRAIGLLPHGKLFVTDSPGFGLFTSDGSIPHAVQAIDEFLATIPHDQSGRSAVIDTIEPDESSAGSADALSRREIEVLRLVAAGKSNQQIADELVISLNTVRRHVSNVFDKTGVANRTEAAIYSKEHGLA